MGENSKISWTDHSFNHVIGCSKVAAGCTHCYAEAFARRFGSATWGPDGTRVKTTDAYWRKPLQWNQMAKAAGVRKRVFCASLADVFEDWDGRILDCHGDHLWVDQETGTDWQTEHPKWSLAGHRAAQMGDVRADLFRLIDATPHLDWLLLTKRPENIFKMWPENVAAWEQFIGNRDIKENTSKLFRRNVWLLTSVATQEDADRNIPLLLKCRELVPVLGVSAEPLLEPVDFQKSCTVACPNGRQCQRDKSTGHRIVQDSSEGGLWVECACSRLGGLNWVIVGGESGPHARPMHPNWARSIRDQCQAVGVPFHFKQWGEWLPLLGSTGPIVTSAKPERSRVIGIDGKDGCPTNSPYFLMDRVGKKIAGRELDGRTWDEFPEVRR